MLDRCVAAGDDRELVDRDHPSRVTVSFEPLEARVDAPPTRADKIDEQREVVDAGVTLGNEIPFEPLEASDGLVEQAPDLGDVTGDGEDLCAQSVAHRDCDLSRNRRFELGCGRREILDLLSRSLESGFEKSWLRTTGGGIRDTLSGAFQS